MMACGSGGPGDSWANLRLAANRYTMEEGGLGAATLGQTWVSSCACVGGTESRDVCVWGGDSACVHGDMLGWLTVAFVAMLGHLFLS